MHIRQEHGREGTGVEVILPTPPNAPYCVHGPGLLFERFSQGDEEHRKFWACSAFRNRKDCPLYVLFDKPWSESKLEERKEIFEGERRARKWYVDNADRSARVQLVRTSDSMHFCKTCSVFIIEPDEPGLHSDHNVIKTSYKTVTNPSTLLTSLTSNEGNAQYLFDSNTSKFISKLISDNKFSHLLCLGTPRIHEMFAGGKKPKSMLLDLDDRFTQFYPPTVFQHYNMSSGFFFQEDGEKYLKLFLKKTKRIALVLDPPFGALARVIGAGIEQLKSFIKEINPDVEVVVMWIFPYFLSKHVGEVQPTLKMCHFVIEYENHPVFKPKNSTKSPVRIFTDQPLKDMALPEEQYKLCEKCEKFVPKEVTHCGKCRSCPPINRTTKHCAKCERCVRDHYVHCGVCEGCRPSTHHCKAPSVCHRCQQPGHKRRHCPMLAGSTGDSTVVLANNQEKKNSGDEKKKKKTEKIVGKSDGDGETNGITDTTEDVKNSDGKSYFTLKSEEEKKLLRQERKRKKKDAAKVGKKSKVEEIMETS